MFQIWRKEDVWDQKRSNLLGDLFPSKQSWPKNQSHSTTENIGLKKRVSLWFPVTYWVRMTMFTMSRKSASHKSQSNECPIHITNQSLSAYCVASALIRLRCHLQIALQPCTLFKTRILPPFEKYRLLSFGDIKIKWYEKNFFCCWIITTSAPTQFGPNIGPSW